MLTPFFWIAPGAVVAPKSEENIANAEAKIWKRAKDETKMEDEKHENRERLNESEAVLVIGWERGCIRFCACF